MAVVRYIKSASEIPAREKYVLVQYGSDNKDVRHSLGVILIIAEHPPDLKQVKHFATVDRAQRLAEKEGIATVYVIERRRASRSKAAKPT